MNSVSRRSSHSNLAAFLAHQPGNSAQGLIAQNLSQPVPSPPPPPPPPPISPPLVHVQQDRPAIPQSRRSPQRRKRLLPPLPWPPAQAAEPQHRQDEKHELKLLNESKLKWRDSPSPPPPPPTPPDTPSPPAVQLSSSLGSWLQQQLKEEEDLVVAGLDSDYESLEGSTSRTEAAASPTPEYDPLLAQVPMPEQADEHVVEHGRTAEDANTQTRRETHAVVQPSTLIARQFSPSPPQSPSTPLLSPRQTSPRPFAAQTPAQPQAQVQPHVPSHTQAQIQTQARTKTPDQPCSLSSIHDLVDALDRADARLAQTHMRRRHTAVVAAHAAISRAVACCPCDEADDDDDNSGCGSSDGDGVHNSQETSCKTSGTVGSQSTAASHAVFERAVKVAIQAVFVAMGEVSGTHIAEQRVDESIQSQDNANSFHTNNLTTLNRSDKDLQACSASNSIALEVSAAALQSGCEDVNESQDRALLLLHADVLPSDGESEMMSAEDSDSDAKSEFTTTSASCSSAHTTDSGADTASSESDAHMCAALRAGFGSHIDSITGGAQAIDMQDLVQCFDNAATGAPLRLAELQSAFGGEGGCIKDGAMSACRERQEQRHDARSAHSVPLVDDNWQGHGGSFLTETTPARAPSPNRTTNRGLGWQSKLWEPPRKPTFLPRTQLPPFSLDNTCSPTSTTSNARSAGHTTQKGSNAKCRTTGGTQGVLLASPNGGRRLDAFRKARAERKTRLLQLQQ